MRQPGASQDINMRQPGASQSVGEEALEAPKKRKLNAISRPKGLINKTKTLGGSSTSNSSILDLFSLTGQTSQASS